MSKERLEELLNDLPYTIRHSGELEPLKQFAREQAERVEELVRKQFNLMVELRKLDDRVFDDKEAIDQLKKENKRYKQALEFYADEENYELDISYNPAQAIDCMILDDSGHQARKALEGED